MNDNYPIVNRLLRFMLNVSLAEEDMANFFLSADRAHQVDTGVTQLMNVGVKSNLSSTLTGSACG